MIIYLTPDDNPVAFSQVPNVKWEDVGGLEDVKKAILDTVQVLFFYLSAEWKLAVASLAM